MSLDDDIRELEQDAETILGEKRRSRPRRPIVIEFCGSPKSGKTSSISSLSIFLRRNRFNTLQIGEKAAVCPVLDKFNPAFNLWTVCSAIADMVAQVATQAKTADAIVADRAIFDAICWFEWLRLQGRLRDEEYERLIGFLTMDRFTSTLDVIYVFKAGPEVSMTREYAHLLTRKRGSIMNPQVLSSYLAAIDTALERHAHKFQKVEVLDTSAIGQDDVGLAVTKGTLAAVRDLVIERVGFVDRGAITMPTEGPVRLSELGPVDLDFAFRDEVEARAELVQPLPVAVFTDKERSRVLVVKKKPKSTGPDSAEKDRVLLYAGGHTRAEDATGENRSIAYVAERTLSRELEEEIGAALVPPSQDPLCVWTRDGTRSEQHLAICYLFEVDFENFPVKLDPHEFVETRGTTVSGRPMPIDDVIKLELESWSAAILEHFFGRPYTGAMVLPFGEDT